MAQCGVQKTAPKHLRLLIWTKKWICYKRYITLPIKYGISWAVFISQDEETPDSTAINNQGGIHMVRSSNAGPLQGQLIHGLPDIIHERSSSRLSALHSCTGWPVFKLAHFMEARWQPLAPHVSTYIQQELKVPASSWWSHFIRKKKSWPGAFISQQTFFHISLGKTAPQALA